MTEFVLLMALLLLGIAILLLAAGVERCHRAAMNECLALRDGVSLVRAQLREVRLESVIAALCAAPVDEPQKPESFNYDTWLRDRTERAHREFMERTSRRLMCDWTTDEIEAYLGGAMG